MKRRGADVSRGAEWRRRAGACRLPVALALSGLALPAVTGCGEDPVSPDAGRDFVLAFVSNRDGNDEVYGLASDGAEVNLTLHPAQDRDPVWSPDGRRLAFTRQTGLARDVWVLDLGTGRLLDVSSHPSADDREPVWSPDGGWIAFTSDRTGDDDLFLVRFDGSGLRNLTHHPGPDREPTWSPDGAEIAFTSARGLRAAIWVVAVEGGAVEPLAPDAYDQGAPRWASSRGAIVFESSRDGASELVQVLRPGGGSGIALAPHPGHDMAARWSPDGTRLVFVSNRDDPLWDVWTVAADGSSLGKISGGSSGRDARPVWSPDGTEIAFESRRTGNWDVFVVRADGANLRALTSDPANDGAVAWRPGR